MGWDVEFGCRNHNAHTGFNDFSHISIRDLAFFLFQLLLTVQPPNGGQVSLRILTNVSDRVRGVVWGGLVLTQIKLRISGNTLLCTITDRKIDKKTTLTSNTFHIARIISCQIVNNRCKHKAAL